MMVVSEMGATTRPPWAKGGGVLEGGGVWAADMAQTIRINQKPSMRKSVMVATPRWGRFGVRRPVAVLGEHQQSVATKRRQVAVLQKGYFGLSFNIGRQ